MKIFRFVKQTFISAIMLFNYYLPCANSLNAIPLNAIPLRFISMNNQPCKARLKLLMLALNIPYFILLVLEQTNVVAIVIILMIP